MKKLSVLLAVVMLVVMCVAGCGSKDSSVNKSDVVNEKQTEEKAGTEVSEKEEVIPADEVEAAQDSDVKEEKEEAADKEEPAKEEEPSVEVPAEKEDTSPSVDLNAVKNAIISGAGVSEPLSVATSRLSSLYGIEANLVKQSACFVTITGAFPDEIVMIEAVDEKAASSIAALLNNRLAEVKEQSKSYDAENYALAQQCTVDRKGCFVSMFLAPQHANMKSIYNSYVK